MLQHLSLKVARPLCNFSILQRHSSTKTMVEYFYDLASPYACLQFHLLQRQIDHWKSMNLQMTPVSIAHVIKGASNSPPINVPAKGQYVMRDVKEQANYYNIPFDMPDIFIETVFKKGTLNTQRFMAALHAHSPELHIKLIRVAFDNFFTRNNPVDISNIDEMKKLASKAGCSSELIAKAEQDMNTDKIKEIFRNNTNRVIELGGFGLPITLVHRTNEPLEISWVFGSDRMHLIGKYLGESKSPILQ